MCFLALCMNFLEQDEVNFEMKWINWRMHLRNPVFIAECSIWHIVPRVKSNQLIVRSRYGAVHSFIKRYNAICVKYFESKLIFHDILHYKSTNGYFNSIIN